MNPFEWFLGPPTQDQFAKMVIAEFRRAGDTRVLEYDKAEFRLTSSDGGQTNLGNVFHEYCQVPRGKRKAHLRDLVQGFLTAKDDLPESFDDVRTNLRPKVWTRATFAALELRERLEGKTLIDIPLYPLGSHLVTTLVYDLPSSMRSISADDLGKWGVSYYEAMEIACENLAESSIAFSRIGDGFHSALSSDSYDSARILLRDQVLSWEVKGDHVAMIPQRDAMYVTGSEDDMGLRVTRVTLRPDYLGVNDSGCLLSSMRAMPSNTHLRLPADDSSGELTRAATTSLRGFVP